MKKHKGPASSRVGAALASFFLAHPELEGRGLLVAYSGGIDSSALLKALADSGRRPLRAVHVVHNLRPQEELRSERTLIIETCRALAVPLTIATLKPGLVEKKAKESGIGIEAAARKLRYKALRRAAARWGLPVIYSAHNRDDQLETLLQRFLFASSLDGLRGIAPLRPLGKSLLLARPLLAVARSDIEAYAASQSLRFSVDSSNAGEDYARNRLRHRLVPLLNKEFPGWKRGLLGTAAKLSEDGAVVNHYFAAAAAACIVDPRRQAASLDAGSFSQAPRALQIRLLTHCLAALGAGDRLSYKALRSAAESLAKGNPSVRALGFQFDLSGTRLEIAPVLDFPPEDRYFFYVVSEGDYRCGPILLSLRWENEGRCPYLFKEAFSFPLIVRSRKPGDLVLRPEGHRRLDDIIKTWRLSPAMRDLVPVVEDRQGIVAVLPSAFARAARPDLALFRNYSGPREGRRLYIRIKEHTFDV